MAVRLSVLVLRPPGNGSSWHAQCDDAIGHLLGRPGLDLTLLERLPELGDGSTEMLALESIGGHVACLAWQEPECLITDLERAGRPMTRRRHAGDPDCEQDAAVKNMSVNGANVGRMYFFDMRQRRDSLVILSDLQTLLKTLQVPTFQIASLGAKPLTVKTKVLNSTVARPVAPSAETTAPSRPDGSRPPVDSDELDRLVAELDELDI